MKRVHHAFGKSILAGSAIAFLAVSGASSFADGIMPKTTRERERHHFRDVQRGVGHPADTETQTTNNSPIVFPWSFLFQQPKSPASAPANPGSK